jgi:hypothetical protein
MPGFASLALAPLAWADLALIAPVLIQQASGLIQAELVVYQKAWNDLAWAVLAEAEPASLVWGDLALADLKSSLLAFLGFAQT